jgi:hypothetical protein
MDIRIGLSVLENPTGAKNLGSTPSGKPKTEKRDIPTNRRTPLDYYIG